MALEVRSFITNRSDFTDIRREVLLLKHSINLEAEEIVMHTRVLYWDINDVDITHKFNKNEPLLTANNSKRRPVYQNGEPLLDGNGDPVTVGMYDYLISMVNLSLVLNDLYEEYIAVNDTIGNFNIAEN